MRYGLALSDADNSGQLGTNVFVEVPWFIGSGSIDDGEHNWYVGPYNEILSYYSGQSGSSGSGNNGIDIYFYVKYKGKWVNGARIIGMFDGLGLKNSRGQALINKYWHKKGLSDGSHTNWRSVNWALRD
jgi:hypothetical protein